MATEQPNESSIFNSARQIESTAERDAFLGEACGEDAELRERIEKLLKAFAAESQFLEQPAPGLEETIVPDASGDNLAASLDAGLASAFGEEAAVVIGDANHSVLRSLGNTLDEVPHVSLRESEAEGDDPITRPNSPEMPDRDSDSRYQLQGEIARGGMGAILKGRDTDLGRDLAIKVLLDSHKDKPEAIQRFVEEAQIGGQLQHPGIAPIYELGQFADKRPFFAMKLVKGQTLSKLLANRDDAADERGKFIGIFEQICQTMAYSHSRGVIHRDMKPANIMVGAFGEVQVMDWGLAKVLQVGGVADEKKSQTQQQGQSIIQTMRSVDSDSPGTFGTLGSQTQMGSVMGTPAYMPPEQALGEIDNMDERADVFGLGAILCEILTGQPPYVGDDGTRVFRMASRGKLDDAFSRLGDCGADEDLIALTKHCLALEPVDRPRDAGVLAERVTGYLESVEGKLREAEVQRAAEAARADAEAAQAEAESARANEERKRRRTSLALAASVLLLVGLGGGGWLYVERQEANQQTAEADAQRKHAVEMQALAEQRDDQRKGAELARNVAEVAQEQAHAEKINSLNMLADMQTERGLLAAREGQSATAALWFANAAALTPHDLDRQRANHLRASSWMNEAIAPAAFLTLPNQPAERFEFQPNGSLLFTLNGAKVRVWDWRNEKVLPWSESPAFVNDAVWSPDGNQLAVALGSETADVRILDPFSGNVLKQFRHSEKVEVIEWSPDGTRLAVGGLHVQIWNVLDEPVQESDWPHPQRVYGLRFNRAGTRLVTSCEDEFARVFAVGDASQSAPLYAPVDHVASRYRNLRNALFFDDDRKLATVAPGSNRLVLRDAATGQPLASDATSSNPGAFDGLAVSPDSRWVAAAHSGVSLLATDGRTVDLKHNHQLTNARFSPDGQSLLTTCWDGTARLWPLHDMTSATPTVGLPIAIPQMGTNELCAFSHDGSCLAISANQQLVIWERSPSELVVGQVAWTEPEWRPRPSFDGQLFTSGVRHTGAVSYGARGDTLQVARVEDGKPAGPPIKLNGLLRDSCVCADNRSVAAATVDGETGRLTIYDIASGAPVIPSIALPDLPISVAARAQPSQVAVLCRNGKLLVVNTQQGQTLLDLSQEGTRMSLHARVVYSPDGATLLSVIEQIGKQNTLVFVRDAQTGELRFPPLQPVLKGGPCRAIAFSPDSRLLATAVNGRNMVQVWDLSTGKKVGREMPHTGDWLGLFSVAFSPDGQRILTGHKDGRARLWDWQTGQLAGTPMSHPFPVYDAQFTTDGRHVVTAGQHSLPQVWDVATGKPAVPLPPQIVLGGRSSHLLAIVGDRVVVTAHNRYSVLDLSLLRKEPTDELTALLARAELTTNQKLQLGELVPLEQAEWTARWEQSVAARPTPEEAAQSLAREFDEAETESVRRAIASRAIRFNMTDRLQQLRPNDPHLQIALAVEFSRAGRQSELKRILPKAIEAYSELITDQTTDATLLSKRAAAYIATEQWELAEVDWRRAIEQQPDLLQSAVDSFANAEQWSVAAEFCWILLKRDPEKINFLRHIIFLADEEQGYVRFCEFVLQQPNDTPLSAGRAIKACLMRAGAVDLTMLPSDVLRNGLEERTTEDWQRPFAWGTLALFAYRSGDAKSAVQYIGNAEKLNAIDLARVQHLPILALAQHELGNSDEARSALDETSRLLTALKDGPNTNASSHVRIHAEILFREAEAKINGKTDSADEASTTPEDSTTTPAEEQSKRIQTRRKMAKACDPLLAAGDTRLLIRDKKENPRPLRITTTDVIGPVPTG